MFDLAIDADDSSLAITLHCFAGAGGLENHAGQQFSKPRCGILDAGPQILDKALTRPRIGHNGSCRDHHQRFAALAALPRSGSFQREEAFFGFLRASDSPNWDHILVVWYTILRYVNICFGHSATGYEVGKGVDMSDLSGLKIANPPATLREIALEKLRDAIIGGLFEPGQRLVERTLCDHLGVSRTVIREVIRHLESEGLVEVIANQGPAVARLDWETARQIYDIRAHSWRPKAAADCAENISPAQTGRPAQGA